MDEVNYGCMTVINGQPCALDDDHPGDHETAADLLRGLLQRIRAQREIHAQAMTVCTPKGESWRYNRDVRNLLDDILRDGQD